MEAFKRDHPDWIAVPAEFYIPPRPPVIHHGMSRMRPRGDPRNRPPRYDRPPPDDEQATGRPMTRDDFSAMLSVAEVLAARRAELEARAKSTTQPTFQDVGTGSRLAAPSGQVIQAQFRRGGGGPTRMPGGGFGELTPQQEFLLYRYNQALEEIRRLEPDNPTLQVLRDPNTPPGINEVLRFEGEVGAARARAAAGRAPRGSAPPGSEGPRVEFKNWDEPTPEQEALEAAKYGRTPEEYADLARDPAQAGRINLKSRQERRVGLELERAGILRGPIRRDPNPKGDFIDADGQRWDVKAFNSFYPPRKGGFALEKSMGDIREELEMGEDVIIDTSNLSATDEAALRVAVERDGVGNRVRWWP